MGAAVSKTPSRLSKRTPPSPTATSPGKNPAAIPHYPTPKPAQRQTPAEWADTLRRVSGVISSATWQEEEDQSLIAQARQRSASDRIDNEHAARRSAELVGKLPRSAAAAAAGVASSAATAVGFEEKRPPGRLTREEMIELFRLRRQQSNEWDAARLAKRFDLDVRDVQHLLAFSRTYMGRADLDGVLRAYYNPEQRNPIMRFERD